jgi:hypothetical protein
MSSIVPFISNAVFEPADIKVMSDAYSKATENIHSFGHPNRIVREMIATRIITLTQGGERDPDRLCERALARVWVRPGSRWVMICFTQSITDQYCSPAASHRVLSGLQQIIEFQAGTVPLSEG